MTTKILKIGDKCRLTIDRLAIGGRGVARHEGVVIFVSDVAPAEIVEVEVTAVKKNFAEARLIEIITPSVKRVTAPCPVFGVCGGCTWQHVAYDEQLRQKRGLVHDALQKFSKFEFAADLVQAVVPSPNEYRYRNRIQLHHRSDASSTTSDARTTLVGFHQRGSHRIVDIEDCPITEKVLTKNLPQLHETFRGKPPGRFEIYLTEDGEVRSRNSFSDTQMSDSFKETSNNKPPQGGPLGSKSGGKKDPRRASAVTSSAGRASTSVRTFAAPPFAQVNTAQNKNLVAHCLDIFSRAADPATTKAVYDLYSGHGNFSFPLGDIFPKAKIEAVELNPQSVQRGNNSARERGLGDRIRFTAGDVAQFLEQKRPPKNSVMLLDPPRMGCAPEVMTAVADAKPSLIVYVSCHPVTLARDLAVFSQASRGGYELIEVRPFDMFPQTDHVETVAVLRRKSEPEKL